MLDWPARIKTLTESPASADDATTNAKESAIKNRPFMW
jgi:hypothetical protein